MIKTIGELKEAINNIDDDFTIDVRIVRELSEEKLKGSRYPYPYEYSEANIEIGDIGYSDKDVFINVEEISDDVCEWKKSKDYPFDWLVGCDGCEVNHRQGDYCPRCGKKIKVVEWMTIDEAIENEKRRAESCKGHYDRFVQMEAKEHEQLAEWLEELKELRNMTASHLYAVAFNRGYLKAEKEVREKAIDDFERKLITHFADWELSNTPYNDDETDRTKEIICETIENAIGGVEEMAEQLKAGGENE